MVDDEVRAFYEIIYDVVREIPPGRVTTYGHIAYLIDKPQNSRQIGTALKYLSHASDASYNHETVPWWRVINSSGRISPRPGSSKQAEILKDELEVSDTSSISLDTYGWFPEQSHIRALQ